jgi:hypothetical protein
MTEQVEVFVTAAQKKKFETGKTFQLSASQLNAGTGKYHIFIEMSTKNHKELLRNVSKNKGYRFTSAKVVGGGFFGDIAKSVGKKVAKTVADKGLDYIGKKTGQSGITNALKGSVDGLVDVAADKITGGRLKKGSPEMREHMARLRSMRKGKGMIEGEGIFDDIKNGWNRTFNKKLGYKIKDALTSGPAKEVYKGIADVGLRLGSDFTGLPLGLAQGSVNNAIDGASIKRRKNVMIRGGTLINGVPQVQILKGKGFYSESGEKYGGSFKSAGGSFASA